MSLTVRDFAAKGLVAGAAGGLAAGLFIRFVTETQIGFALDFEDAAGLGGPPGGPAEFSRSTQYWGGVAAAVLYGAVVGLALGVAVAAAVTASVGANVGVAVAVGTGVGVRVGVAGGATDCPPAGGFVVLPTILTLSTLK